MRGQSTAEFAVAASALMLMLLGMVILAGFQEAQRRTQNAARHAAFLQMWHNRRGGDALQVRLHRLHFDDPGYVRPSGDPAWIAARDIGAASQPAGLQGGAATAAQGLVQPLRVAGGFLNANFDLTAQGYGQTEVSARLRPSFRLPAPFDSLDLTVSHSMSLLGDAWNSADSRQVANRTAGLVPTSVLSGFSTLWRGIAAPLSLLEPNLDRLCLGLIEPEAVPEDRLGPVTAARGAGRCH